MSTADGPLTPCWAIKPEPTKTSISRFPTSTCPSCGSCLQRKVTTSEPAMTLGNAILYSQTIPVANWMSIPTNSTTQATMFMELSTDGNTCVGAGPLMATLLGAFHRNGLSSFTRDTNLMKTITAMSELYVSVLVLLCRMSIESSSNNGTV